MAAWIFILRQVLAQRSQRLSEVFPGENRDYAGYSNDIRSRDFWLILFTMLTFKKIRKVIFYLCQFVMNGSWPTKCPALENCV